MTTNKRLVLNHIFNATPEELWQAWTDPHQFSKWFNPAPGYNLIIHEYDVREGGRIKFDMPQPNGDLNTQEGIFHVLKPYSEIVSGSPDKAFLVSTKFEKIGEKTKMIVEITGVPPEYQEGTVKGWNAIFMKLEKLFSQ